MSEVYMPTKAPPKMPALAERTESVRDEVKGILREKRAEEKELAALGRVVSECDSKFGRNSPEYKEALARFEAKKEIIWALESEIYEESATEKAIQFRGMKIKDIFGCPFLVDKEVLLFTRWFRENYGYDASASPKGELAEAVYAYTERNETPVRLMGGKAGPGFQIVSWSEEGEGKSDDFFAGSNSSLRALLEKRQGQCVALTTLYCALAEELGVKAMPMDVREYQDGKSAERGEDDWHFAAAVSHEAGNAVFDPVNNIPYAKHKGVLLEKEFLLIGSLTDQGVAMRKDGKYNEAIALYDQALELNPNYVLALADKGNALCSLGKYDEAIICYDKALEINPNYVAALADKGVALNSLERHMDALVPLDRAIELNPEHFTALAEKGTALAGLARYEEALEYYDHALEVRPDAAAVLRNRDLVLNAIRMQGGAAAEAGPA